MPMPFPPPQLMNLSGSLSLNCEPQHPPPFDGISSLLLRWATSPPLLLLDPSRLYQLLTNELTMSKKKRAANYGGSVISSPMSVVSTSLLKNRGSSAKTPPIHRGRVSFTLAGVTEYVFFLTFDDLGVEQQCIDGYSIKKERFWMITEELPQCLRSPTPRLELLQPEKVAK
ncbi:hypothetical protein DVH24_023112 [Malus domestica]|uniref:Uncharacterized protein n=1 Tax=Malus domestica TaxID=3750 RepID=A0A498KMI2_MALDO|nr:hypothetical protein DVH24_023112 [Malus domestica]